MYRSLSKLTDKELWNLLRKSDKEAFSLLYDRHIESLYNFGLRLTSNHELIKDTLQELFIEYWSKRASLKEVEHVKVYLLKSFRYKLLRSISKTSKLKTYSFEELLSELPHFDTNVEETEIALKRKSILKEKLKQLPERQREVIHLRYFQNLKNDEIADIINVNYQSVSNLLYRGLKKLRHKIVSQQRLPK